MPKFQNFNAEGEFMSNFYVQRDEEKDDTGLDFTGDEGKTKQEFRDECDINVLMERYEKSGVISNLNTASPRYLDLGDASHLDLMHAMQVLNEAEASFMSLPAKVRAEFDNDAMAFVEFAENPDNIDRMREFGLVKPKEVEAAPLKVEVVGSLDTSGTDVSKAAAPKAPEKAS